MLQELQGEAMKLGFEINTTKTKFMTMSIQTSMDYIKQVKNNSMFWTKKLSVKVILIRLKAR